MIYDRKARKHYNIVRKFNTKKECDTYINGLSQKEKRELFIFIDSNIIVRKKRTASPITEYILTHYEDYMTKQDIQTRDSANKTMFLLFTVIPAACCIFAFCYILFT